MAVRTLLLSLALLVAACGPRGEDAAGGVRLAADTTEASPRFEGIPEGDVVLAERLPRIDRALADFPEERDVVGRYARRALHPQTITARGHIEEAYVLRDAHVIPALRQPAELFFGDHADQPAELEALEVELAALGLRGVWVEGMLVAVDAAELLPEQTAALGGEDLQLYARFMEAAGRSMGGEYPYLDMGPRTEMVEFGERLVAEHPQSRFTAAMRESFDGARLALADVHRVMGEYEYFAVGAMNTEHYPWETELESRRAMASAGRGTFAALLGRILADLSEVAPGHEHYAVVVADAPDHEAARLRVVEFLDRGIDVPHAFSIGRPDGSQRFVVAYRFFPDRARAERAAARIAHLNPRVEAVDPALVGM